MQTYLLPVLQSCITMANYFPLNRSRQQKIRFFPPKLEDICFKNTSVLVASLIFKLTQIKALTVNRNKMNICYLK